MLADHLVLAALDRQDNLAIVLQQTVAGRPPIIAEANDAFHRLTGLPREAIDGETLTILTRPPTPPEWHHLLAAISAGEPLRGEVPCYTGADQIFWFGFTLCHMPDPLGGPEHPVLTGRDITVDRWKRQDQTTTSALFGLAFTKIDAAVVLVRDDGRIIIANPAMAALTGFTVEDLDGKPVRDLTHPKDVARASAAHSRQLADGERYQMQLVTRARNGMISVQLTSELVEEPTLGRVSIATLIPEPTAASTSGRVETVSLQAIRVACGEAWERMSGRLVMMAESVIRQRLKSQDVFARSADCNFTVWFATDDEAEAAACVATITRDIRIRLLGELGTGILTGATGMPIHAASDALADSPPVSALLQPEARPRQRQQQGIANSRALGVIAELSGDTPVEITRVTNCDDQPAGLIWADLPLAARLRLDAAVASLPEDALLGAGLAAYPELLRLRFAAAGIKRDLVEGQRQVWLLPASCTALLSRKRRKQLLDTLRNTQAPVRARLRALLSDVPPGPLVEILRDWFEPSGPLLQSIGVLSCVPDLPQASTLCAPVKLVAIDLDTGPPPPMDTIVKMLDTAQKLGLAVMVRTSRRDQARTWRELGATLFAITKSSA
jgi:PAS domain S-box-containing protein